MNKIKWCLQQKSGIMLVEPNNNTYKAYLLEADDSLVAMERNVGTWKVVTAYYAGYSALYALLQKAGIKCEIHDCTLLFMNFFGFTEDEIVFLQQLKKDRTDSQYYLKKVKEPDTVKIKSFVLHCKMLGQKLNYDAISKIRGLVKND